MGGMMDGMMSGMNGGVFMIIKTALPSPGGVVL